MSLESYRNMYNFLTARNMHNFLTDDGEYDLIKLKMYGEFLTKTRNPKNDEHNFSNLTDSEQERVLEYILDIMKSTSLYYEGATRVLVEDMCTLMGLENWSYAELIEIPITKITSMLQDLWESEGRCTEKSCQSLIARKKAKGVPVIVEDPFRE